MKKNKVFSASFRVISVCCGCGELGTLLIFSRPINDNLLYQSSEEIYHVLIEMIEPVKQKQSTNQPKKA